MPHQWIRAIWLLGGLVAVFVILKLWILAPEPIPVTVVRVERGLVQKTVTNSRAGTVKARRRAQISPETGGRIVAIPYRKGQHVKAGDVLIQLNDATQRANLLMAKRELVVATTQKRRICLEAQRAQRELLRNQKLRQDDLISADRFDQIASLAQTRAAACQAAEANIEKAKAAIIAAQAELDKTVVRAPFDGVVAELHIEIGEWTTPSPPALPIPPALDLIDPQSIYISAPMDEVDSAILHPSQPAIITLDPYPDSHFSGRVTSIAPYVLDREEQNRTVEIEVEFDDKEFAGSLLPGTSADVEVILRQKTDVLRIPTFTLLEGNHVLVVEEGQAVNRSVTVGLKNWDFVEITNGLAEGALVIQSLDRENLGPGVPVTITQESPSS